MKKAPSLTTVKEPSHNHNFTTIKPHSSTQSPRIALLMAMLDYAIVCMFIAGLINGAYRMFGWSI